MVARLEWVAAGAVSAEVLDHDELEQLALEEPVGEFGLVVHSGDGDGAVIEGEASQIAEYLSDAAVLLSRRTGAPLRPKVYADHVAKVVNAAADDVLKRLRQAGINVGSGMESLTNLLVNVAVNRVRSGPPQSVDDVIRANWPDADVEEVLWWCLE
jgi:hypothetical protein